MRIARRISRASCVGRSRRRVRCSSYARFRRFSRGRRGFTLASTTVNDASDRYRSFLRSLIAASALASACGHARDSSDWDRSLTNTTNVPPRESTRSGDDAHASATASTDRGGACPATAPEPGTLCDVSRLPHAWCRYPAQSCAGDDLYRCTDGLWQPPRRECMGVGPLPPPDLDALSA